MAVTTEEVVVCVVVGALAGSFVAVLATRRKEGYGRFANLAIGMAGAIVGGLLFKLFNINLGLKGYKITAEDLVSAVIGAVILLLAMWIFGKLRSRKKES
jgi:uncharacterized membrane protein YeaQ/YmgE (transglycosylase-associated protein family)